jgi:large subunit ribosomal protein L33
MRVNITLECTSCKERNYLTNKNKRNNPDRLEKMKYCPRERKDTLHKRSTILTLMSQQATMIAAFFYIIHASFYKST